MPITRSILSRLNRHGVNELNKPISCTRSCLLFYNNKLFKHNRSGFDHRNRLQYSTNTDGDSSSSYTPPLIAGSPGNNRELITTTVSYESRIVDYALRELVSLLEGNSNSNSNSNNTTIGRGTKRLTRGAIQNIYWNMCALLRLDPLVIEEHARCDTVSETAVMTFLLLMVLQHYYGSDVPYAESGVANFRLWIEDKLLRAVALQDTPNDDQLSGWRSSFDDSPAVEEMVADSQFMVEGDSVMFLLHMIDCMRHELPTFCPRPRKNMGHCKHNDALVQSIFVLLDIALFKPLPSFPTIEARLRVSEMRQGMDSGLRSQLCFLAIDAILEHSTSYDEGIEAISEIMSKMSKPDVPFMRLDEHSVVELIRKSHNLQPAVRWKWLLYTYRSHGVCVTHDMLEHILEECHVFGDDGTIDSIMQFVTRNPLLMTHRVASLLRGLLCNRAHGALDHDPGVDNE